jgi:hypothetical protein
MISAMRLYSSLKNNVYAAFSTEVGSLLFPTLKQLERSIEQPALDGASSVFRIIAVFYSGLIVILNVIRLLA